MNVYLQFLKLRKMSKIVFLCIALLSISASLKSDFSQTGRASFYANKFQGRRTASGEVFKQDLLTAAHKTLPFGTLVKVKNLRNDSLVVVKINDRLPKSSSTILDLTLSAAKQLNFVHQGHTKVSLTKTN
jgi:rare lipoprotein A